MLIRSSSTPILKSWISSNYFNTCTNSFSNNINELTPTVFRTSSTSTFTTSSPSSSPNYTSYANPSKRSTHPPLFESDLRDPPRPKTTSLQRLFSSSRLDEEVVVAEDGDGGSVGGGDGNGMNGGDGHDGDGGYEFNEHGSMEEYYQKTIKANPGDPLLLGNYARFLKDGTCRPKTEYMPKGRGR